MEHYLATKKNTTLPFGTTWMDLEGTILSDMSDTEKQILYNLSET